MASREERGGRRQPAGGGGGGGSGGAGSRGKALAARAHSEGRGRHGLAGVGGDDGRRSHPHGPQFLHLALQPAVLLCQRAEAALQVLALHLRLLELCPASHFRMQHDS